MTRITLHDTQEPFTPNRDRAGGFYRNREDTPVDAPLFLREPEFQSDPATDYEAIIAALKAQLDAKPAFDPHAAPANIVVPEFLQSVPDELTDLVRENEPYGESQARLWQLYVNLQSRIADNGLSMDLPTPDQYALHSRLSRHLEWLRGTGAVDVI